MSDEGYWIYRQGDRVRIVITDQDGRGGSWELDVRDARKFFRKGVLACAEPKSLADLWIHRWRVRRAVRAP